MNKYFDWRIDDKKVDNLLWLRENNGTFKVVREYDGVWKWDKEKLERVDKNDPNVILNSNHDVTDTCLGEAVIKTWKANGCPNNEPLKTKENIGDIFIVCRSASWRTLSTARGNAAQWTFSLIWVWRSPSETLRGDAPQNPSTGQKEKT
jgi:hypothetical protein